MMTLPVDIDLLRKNPEIFKESFRKRGLDESIVDRALELDSLRTSIQRELDSLRHRKNILSKAYGLANMWKSGKITKEEFIEKIVDLGFDIHEGTEYEDFVTRLKEDIEYLEEEIKKKEEEYKRVYNEFIITLWHFPNLVHPEVPLGGEENNTPIKFWGVPRVYVEYLQLFKDQTEKFGWRTINILDASAKDELKSYIKNEELFERLVNDIKKGYAIVDYNFNDVLNFEKLNKDKIVVYALLNYEPKHHYDLIKEFNLADTDKAGEVAGSRFYFEFDTLAKMDLALSMLAIDVLQSKGYKLIIPPYMLRKHILDGIITLDDYEDMMYKIEGEDLYLIGTAEHPITALYYNEIINEEELPIKIVGWSPCFRKEAGAHGKDTKGIFRVHQFHKVEQYIFSKPEESEKLHQELIRNAEEFLEMLNIPYRTVIMASEDMGKRNYKQYDVEGWFPGQGKYRELVSGSNVTDWQSRRSNIRYRSKEDNKLYYVHTLNCTLSAVQRTLTAILENYFDYSENSIYIPKILSKYVDKDKIVRN